MLPGSEYNGVFSVIFSIIFSITAEPWRERLGESDGEIDIPICQLEFRLGEAAFFAEVEDVGDSSAPLFTLNPCKSNPTKIAFAVPLGQLMRQCRNYLGAILFLTFPGASRPWYSQPCTKDGRQKCKALRRLFPSLFGQSRFQTTYRHDQNTVFTCVCELSYSGKNHKE